MFVFRLTQKMLKEMDAEPTEVKMSVPLTSWHVNLYMINRKKSIVFVNDRSLLCLILTGVRNTQYKKLSDIFRIQLHKYLTSEGLEDALIQAYINEGNKVTISGSSNRSVLGTMNEIMFVTKEMSRQFTDQQECNRWMNRVIYKPIDYERPIEVFKREMKEYYDVGLAT